MFVADRRAAAPDSPCGGTSTPVEPATGSTITAAMVEAIVQRHQPLQLVGQMHRPTAGWPRVKALCSRSWVCGEVVDARHHQRAEHACGCCRCRRPRCRRSRRRDSRARGRSAGCARPRRARGDSRRRSSAPYPPTSEPELVKNTWLSRDRAAGRSAASARSKASGWPIWKVGRIVQLGDLGLHRLDDLGAAVAGIDAPQARGAVQHLRPSDARVMHALGRASRRGAALNWRLAVNGIQKADRSIWLLSSMGVDLCRRGCWRDWALFRRGPTIAAWAFRFNRLSSDSLTH